MSKRHALRRRRDEADMSQEEVAIAAGMATSTYATYESGKRTPRKGKRIALARVFDCTLDEINADFAITLNGHGGMPEWMAYYIQHEQGAAELWAFGSSAIHGLLQTREYARAVEEADPEPAADQAIVQRVETRMARQEVLTRSLDPLELSLIVDESVLYRVAGNAEVMVEQLDHLLEVGQLRNVTVQVLPFNSGVFVPGSFTLFTRPVDDGPSMVCIFDRGGANYIDRPDGLAAHATLFRHLGDTAYPPERSASLIQTAKEHHRTMNDPTWRKSTHSSSGDACVEVSLDGDDVVRVRDSKDPLGGHLRFTRAEMAAWIAGCKDGEFDDLA